ncbi:RING-type E3 ubiquitin-protein ligase PPIL2, partial [Tachysurus ichikawai]
MLNGRLEFVSTSIRSGQANPRAKQAHYSTGRVSASFTSTAMTPATAHVA